MLFSNTFLWVAGFALIAALINGLGIYAVYKNKNWAQRIKNKLMCFAAGVLITVPLTFAFPNAVEKNIYAGFSALAGFLFIFFSNNLIRKKTKQKHLTFGLTAAEGIGIHSFVDGVIYAVTFSASIFIGLLSGIGLILHEFAEGVIIFSALIKAKVNKKKAAVYAFFIASLTTPLGAFVAYPFVNRLNSEILGLLLGFVVGILIYLSASHLLPEARKKNHKHSVWAFLSGVLLALIIVFSKII